MAIGNTIGDRLSSSLDIDQSNRRSPLVDMCKELATQSDLLAKLAL